MSGVSRSSLAEWHAQHDHWSNWCLQCGYHRSNVRHRVDRADAPEGPFYFRDIEFCEFREPANERASWRHK